MEYPKIPEAAAVKKGVMLEAPPKDKENIEIEKGPNVSSIPDFDPIEDNFELPIVLKMADNISTDEILAGGSRVLPFRSNIPKISSFVFEGVDEGYIERAEKQKDAGGHMVVAGNNYGQGSSREHAALAPRYLGLRVVLVKDFARIHLQNLINFGILPLTFDDPSDHQKLSQGDVLEFRNIHQTIRDTDTFTIRLKDADEEITVHHSLTGRDLDILLAGGIINWAKQRQ
ncbi:hypothetical protein GCM10022378_19680 [Salinicoccus jeotgali]|uniref:Aconitase A/isopropylmalate dehydratase small subunit swivel domain-containing protein n=1 Tax=Salinicoccus jeotgali TaxID=381634 RepID=A0ABP7F525_9STAP